MVQQLDSEVSDLQAHLKHSIKRHRKLFLFQGALLVVFGALSIAMPLVSTYAIELLLGWLFLIGGVVRLLMLVRIADVPGYWWSLLSAALSVPIGGILIAQPFQGELTLTMLLLVFFSIDAVVSIGAAMRFREHFKAWLSLMLNGLLDIVLAFLIWKGWPDSAGWAVGLLVGVNLLLMGFSLAALALEARHSH